MLRPQPESLCLSLPHRLHEVASLALSLLFAALFCSCPGFALPETSGATPPAATGDRSQSVPVPEAIRLEEKNKILLSKPRLEALISVSRLVNPFNLEASQSTELTLAEALKAALANSLPISISTATVSEHKWRWISASTGFLPDLSAGYSYFGVDGTFVLPVRPAPTRLRVDSPFIFTTAGFTYYGYQGGRVLFGALQARHNLNAARAGLRGTISDVFLDVANQYYDLQLQEALLEIRIRAVETSAAQLLQDRDLMKAGIATNLDVLQAETQLSRDRTNLVAQQVARRNSSIRLARLLNHNLTTDLIPTQRLIYQTPLIEPDVPIGKLTALALTNRPELKQYNEQRLASRNAIVVAASPLHPTVQLSGQVIGTGETAGHSVAVSSTGERVSKGVDAAFLLGLSINWHLAGLGLTDSANIQVARAVAREAYLRYNDQVTNVIEQTRTSYNAVLRSAQEVEETGHAVASSEEQLRLAQLRFKQGAGTNIDIIQAQRDYTASLVAKAEAIVGFNKAHAKLIHDIGLITIQSLTSDRPLRID